jgi:hypothetical protein
MSWKHQCLVVLVGLPGAGECCPSWPQARSCPYAGWRAQYPHIVPSMTHGRRPRTVAASRASRHGTWPASRRARPGPNCPTITASRCRRRRRAPAPARRQVDACAEVGVARLDRCQPGAARARAPHCHRHCAHSAGRQAAAARCTARPPPASAPALLEPPRPPPGGTPLQKDALGNRKKCEAACKEALLAGRNVVVDRVNFNEQQRAVWVHLGRAVCGSALQLIVLQLVVPIDVCKQRMREEALRAAAGGTPKDTDHLVDRCDARPRSLRRKTGLACRKAWHLLRAAAGVPAPIAPRARDAAAPPPLPLPRSFAADLTLTDPWSEGFDQVYTISREEQAEAFVEHVTSDDARGLPGAALEPAAGPAAGRTRRTSEEAPAPVETPPPPPPPPPQQQHQQHQQAEPGRASPVPMVAAAPYFWAGGTPMQAAGLSWGGVPFAGGAVPAGAYNVAVPFSYGAVPMPGVGWVPVMAPAGYAPGMQGVVPGVMTPTAGAAAGAMAVPMPPQQVVGAAAAALSHAAAGGAPPAAPGPGAPQAGWPAPPSGGPAAAARARKAPPRRAISQLAPQDMPPWWRPKGDEFDEPVGTHPAGTHPYAPPPPPPPPLSAGPALPAAAQHQHQQPAPPPPPPPPPQQPARPDSAGLRARRPPGRSATFSGMPSATMAPRVPPAWPGGQGGSRASSGRPSPMTSRRASYEVQDASARSSFGDAAAPPPPPPAFERQQIVAAAAAADGALATALPPPSGPLSAQQQPDAPGGDGAAAGPAQPQQQRGGGGGSGGGAAVPAADDEDVPPGQLASSRPGVFLDLLPATGPPSLRVGLPAQPGPEGDARIILLFDLNGTLVSHASRRRSAGNSRLRPGLALLARLLPRFRLGLYTSSTGKTVCVLRALLEAAAGQPLFEPGLTLYRCGVEGFRGVHGDAAWLRASVSDGLA